MCRFASQNSRWQYQFTFDNTILRCQNTVCREKIGCLHAFLYFHHKTNRLRWGCVCYYMYGKAYGTGVHIWYQGDSYMYNGHKKSENGSWQQMWPASCWLHVRVNKSWATTRSLTHDVYVAHSQWCDHTKTDTWRLRRTFSMMRPHEDLTHDV